MEINNRMIWLPNVAIKQSLNRIDESLQTFPPEELMWHTF